MILKTSRLNLYPLSSVSFEKVCEMFRHPFTRQFLFDDIVFDDDQIKDFLKISDELFKENKYGLWVLSQKSSGEMIGFAGLWHFFEEGQPQLVYALLPEFTGKGYALEASKEITSYSFSSLGFNYLDASCDGPNLPSHKTALSLGMKKTTERNIDGKPITFYRIQKS
jgi:ribosomal-protein-alanine N-acetyltransferase